MGKSIDMKIKMHVDNAEDLRKAAYHLNRIFERSWKMFSKNRKLRRLLERVCPYTPNSIFSRMKAELDSECHREISDAQFQGPGQPYYPPRPESD